MAVQPSVSSPDSKSWQIDIDYRHGGPFWPDFQIEARVMTKLLDALSQSLDTPARALSLITTPYDSNSSDWMYVKPTEA